VCVCGWVCRQVSRTEYQIILLALFFCPPLYFQFILLFLNLIFFNSSFRCSCRDSSRKLYNIPYHTLSFAMNNLCECAPFNQTQQFQPLSYVGWLLILLQLQLPFCLLIHFSVLVILSIFYMCFYRVYL
jgi:hypothetical protein